MSAKRARSLGIILLILSIICVFAALISRDSLGSQISQRWQGNNGSYSCAGESGVVDDIVAMQRPRERKTDPTTGDTYLRYSRNLVIVRDEGTPSCRVTIEDLSRVNNGTFIWLGGGFAPSSPSSSSGGSSGSGGGIK